MVPTVPGADKNRAAPYSKASGARPAAGVDPSPPVDPLTTGHVTNALEGLPPASSSATTPAGALAVTTALASGIPAADIVAGHFTTAPTPRTFVSQPAVAGSWRQDWVGINEHTCGRCGAQWDVVAAVGHPPQGYHRGGQRQIWAFGDAGRCECSVYWRQM